MVVEWAIITEEEVSSVDIMEEGEEWEGVEAEVEAVSYDCDKDLR